MLIGFDGNTKRDRIFASWSYLQRLKAFLTESMIESLKTLCMTLHESMQWILDLFNFRTVQLKDRVKEGSGFDGEIKHTRNRKGARDPLCVRAVVYFR
jgi:hypothetical protein